MGGKIVCGGREGFGVHCYIMCDRMENVFCWNRMTRWKMHALLESYTTRWKPHALLQPYTTRWKRHNIECRAGPSGWQHRCTSSILI